MGDIREPSIYSKLPDVIPNTFTSKIQEPSLNPDQNEADRRSLTAGNDLNNNNTTNKVLHGVVVETEEERIAKRLARDIVGWAASSDSSTCGKYEEAMRSQVGKFMQRSEIPFRAMYSKLVINETNVCAVYKAIADEMLSVGDMNRGRLVGLYCMAAELSKHFVRQGLDEHLDTLGRCVGEYVAAKYSSWIRNNGGWDGFVEFFSDECRIEKGLWKGLLATAAIGFGALATMVLVK